VGMSDKNNELKSFPWNLYEAQDNHTDEYRFMIVNFL
jgi:hypothetical protein